MISLKQIKINARDIYGKDKELIIKKKICSMLRINNSDIHSFKILKEALDARKKPDIYYTYNCAVSLSGKLESKIASRKKAGSIIIDYYTEYSYEFPVLKVENFSRPVIVGSGPAGLFATYYLAKSGFRPIMIERGSAMKQRKEKVDDYINNRNLDVRSNIQFGEGGAGTFSDGKLNTGSKDKAGLQHCVLETFVNNGAKDSILYENKPHIGTDVLANVVVSMRNEILRHGGTVLFDTMLNDLNIENGKLKSIVANDEITPCDNLILAIGHSARDTFRMLYKNNLNMCSKPFAVGVRVIHEQKYINESQYGSGNDFLPAADYKITEHTEDGRSVYSFCMCPGGYVVPAASDVSQSVVNGMSYSNRDGKYANSAMLVNVSQSDFKSDDLFAGMQFQDCLEKYAYDIANGLTPIQSGYSFINNSADDHTDLINIAKESILGEVKIADVRSIFPDYLSDALCKGICLADRRFKGFSENIKLVAGVETRTSSPVKILRNDDYESNISGIYPCGEGAGYAGGIMSAAVDGIRVAAAIANKINGDI